MFFIVLLIGGVLTLLFLLPKGQLLIRKHILAARFPGPPALPIIGNALTYLGKEPHEYADSIFQFARTYGDCYRIWIGLEFNLFFSNLQDVEVILNDPQFNNKAAQYDYLKTWLNQGLLLSENQKWFRRRKIITPSFHFKTLEGFVVIFDQHTKRLADALVLRQGDAEIDLYALFSLTTLDIICGHKWHGRRKIITPGFHFKILEEYLKVFEKQSRMFCKILQKHVAGEPFELIELVNRYTMDVISESAMGVSVNAQTNTDSEYVRAVKTISTVLHKRMFDIIYRFDFTYWFTKLAREEKKALAVLHGFTEKIIVQRREEILRGQKSKTVQDTNDVGSKRKMAFLDILLQSEIDGKPLSNLDIREEVDTFMFEGHDTTSSAITFLFYNLAIYPESQKKCFQEICEIFGNDKTKPATYEDLNNMHYTELCIKETLRLYPSVPLLGRKVTKECEINGKIIPAGTNIGISPLHLGRMEEIFPKANEFIPERFDVVTNTEKMHPYAYIPFSAGPRNCIGQKFAMLEIKSVVANVLRNFEIQYVGTASGEPLLIGELILRTRDPLMFKLKARAYN